MLIPDLQSEHGMLLLIGSGDVEYLIGNMKPVFAFMYLEENHIIFHVCIFALHKKNSSLARLE